MKRQPGYNKVRRVATECVEAAATFDDGDTIDRKSWLAGVAYALTWALGGDMPEPSHELVRRVDS
jgi:hypothetical protein